MCAAGGIAIHKRAEADLMGNAGSGQSFGDDPDRDAEHGGTAIETLGLLELFQMDFAGCSGLEPVVVGHGDLAQSVKNCNAVPLSAPIQLIRIFFP
mgnify:CR=1 FL=1